jgi:hypothetical protein
MNSDSLVKGIFVLFICVWFPSLNAKSWYIYVISTKVEYIYEWIKELHLCM